MFSKKKREDKKRNKKMKSKLTDEDIPDLADIMGEKCFSVYSDNLLLHGNTTCIATSREWSSILNIIIVKPKPKLLLQQITKDVDNSLN